MDEYLDKNGFNISVSEPTLYVKSWDKNELLIVCLYVCDFIYIGNTEMLMDEFRVTLKNELEMLYLGLIYISLAWG